MEKKDTLFGLFREAGAEIRKLELQQVNGGNIITIPTEYEAGMCHDPDGAEPINDCFPDEKIIEMNC
ncbi:MAG: hypothetical protein KDC66_14170 [Phaeodactylibacter sp.]|nr:hypothetical protein [Phaeodactylibacter sp.]MCB9275532.1 hypothetical protein [Lewinellaceae bacterium]